MTFIALCPWSPRHVLVLCNRGIFMARSPVVGVRSCGAPRYIHRNKVMRSPWENERDRLKGENDKLERDGDYDREARTLLPEIPPRNWFHPSFPFWFFFAFFLFSLFPLAFLFPTFQRSQWVTFGNSKGQKRGGLRRNRNSQWELSFITGPRGHNETKLRYNEGPDLLYRRSTWWWVSHRRNMCFLGCRGSGNNYPSPRCCTQRLTSKGKWKEKAGSNGEGYR